MWVLGCQTNRSHWDKVISFNDCDKCHQTCRVCYWLGLRQDRICYKLDTGKVPRTLSSALFRCYKSENCCRFLRCWCSRHRIAIASFCRCKTGELSLLLKVLLLYFRVYSFQKSISWVAKDSYWIENHCWCLHKDKVCFDGWKLDVCILVWEKLR